MVFYDMNLKVYNSEFIGVTVTDNNNNTCSNLCHLKLAILREKIVDEHPKARLER